MRSVPTGLLSDWTESVSEGSTTSGAYARVIVRTTRMTRKRVIMSKVGVSVKILGGVGDVGFNVIGKTLPLVHCNVLCLSNNNSVKALK